jgi:hypothetical protein
VIRIHYDTDDDHTLAIHNFVVVVDDTSSDTK